MNKLLVVLFCLFSFAAMVCAQGAAAPAAEKAAPAKKAVVKTLSCTGTVVSVDTAAKSVVVKDTKSAMDMTFTAKAKDLAKVKADETVTVKYKEGTTEAISVKVAKKVKAAAPAAEKAAPAKK